VAAVAVEVSLLVALVVLAVVVAHQTLQALRNQTSPVVLAHQAKAMLAATASSLKEMHSVKVAVVVVQGLRVRQLHPPVVLELAALVFPILFKPDHLSLMAVVVAVVQLLTLTPPVALAVVVVAHLELAGLQLLVRQTQVVVAVVEPPTGHKTLLAVAPVSS
jgi:hypothetical protein